VEGSDRPIEGRFPSNGADPIATASAIWQGPSDPQMRVGGGRLARAMRTAYGVATVLVERSADRTEILARAWGAGDAAEAALAMVPGLSGAMDDPAALSPRHDLVVDLVRRLPGLRLTRTGSVMDALVLSILAQKVTGLEVHRAWSGLLRRYGDAAPGPFGLFAPPPPERLAKLPYWAFHPFGVERRRADAIRAAAAVAPRLEAIRDLSHAEAERRLMSLPNIGAWTAAETMRFALGDPDALSVGDYHLARVVCTALAGERDGDDARMLELLEPYPGQRARVALLIERGGLRGERHGPRMAPRSIAAI
jgi:3-methyladenine DNA glycosylase/8-oxoguanine DNA glycosylase